MANLVVVSPLPQTSAPCFLLKPLPLDNLCFFVFTTYSLTKSKWNKPLPLIVQGFSLSCSLCFSFLGCFCCLLPSSLSLSHLWPEEKHFHLPPSYHFFLNLSFKVCPRCPSVPCSLLGTLPWRDTGGPTSFQFVPTKTSSGNARLSKEQVQSCVPGGEGRASGTALARPVSDVFCLYNTEHEWASSEPDPPSDTEEFLQSCNQPSPALPPEIWGKYYLEISRVTSAGTNASEFGLTALWVTFL